jgi:hypothetical protein
MIASKNSSDIFVSPLIDSFVSLQFYRKIEALLALGKFLKMLYHPQLKLNTKRNSLSLRYEIHNN